MASATDFELRISSVSPSGKAPTLSCLREGAHVAAWGLLCFAAACSRKPAASQSPPAEVLVTDVKQEDVPIFDEFVSTLDSSVNASIQARVQG